MCDELKLLHWKERIEAVGRGSRFNGLDDLRGTPLRNRRPADGAVKVHLAQLEVARGLRSIGGCLHGEEPHPSTQLECLLPAS